jgi:CheY-like chemotaxis protein
VADSGTVKTIVYIEDNQTNLDLVVRILESTGLYRVLGAADGETGLGVIAAEQPVLVLVDLDIPGVNGFEVTRQLKGSDDPALTRTPVVAVSANVLKNERAAALEAGCIDFIEKPFDISAFRERIAALIEAAT